MIAYKATYNFKCLKQLYRVGKTYTSDKLVMCRHGFHFCKNVEDTLNYYGPNENFILLEIEVLGTVIDRDDKSVTDKIKVLRVVPFEEYTDTMKSNFPVFEYDSNNNLISKTHSNGRKTTFEYDSNNNPVSYTTPNGSKTTFEYDSNNNCISYTIPNGAKYTFEYDSNNNRTSYTTSNGSKTTYEYDSNNNCISHTTPNGSKTTYEYDSNNNPVSYTTSNGIKNTYEITNVIEE